MKRILTAFMILICGVLQASPSNQVVLSQIGATYNRTAAEISASVTPTNYGYPPGDVRRYGAAGDGTTNDTTAIQSALNVGGVITLQCVTYRAATGITVPQGSYLTSQVCGDSSTVTHGATIQCDLSVATCLTLGGSGATNGGVSVQAIRVTRASGSIPANSVGVLVQNLYNVSLSNVFSQRHSIGFKFLSDGSNGIAAQADKLFTCAITDADVDDDTWPELRIINSRFGCNGPNDQNRNTFIRVTGGSTTNAAAGPNTLYVANTQFNTGGSVTSGCWLQFSSQLPSSISDTGDLSFVNVHVETIGTAYVCSDSTWTLISRFKVTNSHFNSVKPFLSLNSATTANNWLLSNNHFAGGFSLAPSSQFNYVQLTNNFINGSSSITGVSSSTWVSTGNIYNTGLTYSGAFAVLASVGDSTPNGSFTLSATGGSPNAIKLDGSSFSSGTWTPGISFGGGTTGQTFSRQAGRYQIHGNQLVVNFSIIFTAIGSSTGAATLTGLPFAAGSVVPVVGSGGLVANSANMAGLSAAPIIINAIQSSTSANLYQQAATGVNAITNANFTNTTSISGSMTYEWQ